MVELFAGQGIDDRFVWVRVSDPGLDHINSCFVEQEPGLLGSNLRNCPRFAPSPAGQVIDRCRRDQQHDFGPIAQCQRSDSVEELGRFRRLMGYCEKTSHLTTSV